MVNNEWDEFPPPPDEEDGGPFFADYLFDNLDGSPSPAPDVQWVLRDIQPGRRAGKSYKPDPSGKQRAVKASDYRSGSQFFANYRLIDNLYDLYHLLKHLATDPTAFLVRGKLVSGTGKYGRHRRTGETGYKVNRRTAARHADGCFEPQERRMLMVDLDELQLPAGMSTIVDPRACVLWAVENRFPPEFRDADFVYQLSASAGLTKADDRLNAHLWFFTDRAFCDEKLRYWAFWWNAKRHIKVLDPALYNAVQPHYVTNPGLEEGLVDPLAGRRLGWFRGNRRAVPLYMPTAEEVVQEIGRKRQRAAAATEASTGGGIAKPQDPDGQTAGDKTLAVSEDDVVVDDVGTNIGAVRDGPGWRGYLAMIGFEGHIRTQIKAAIGRYFYDNGSRAALGVIKEAIEKAINNSPYLDCDAPWSRSRKEALAYLVPAGRSNVDGMIRDISGMQKQSEQRADDLCDATWPLPDLTAEEAFEKLQKEVCSVVFSALWLRASREEKLRAIPAENIIFDADPFESTETEVPSQVAVLCEPGVGKTEAMIKWVDFLLSADRDVRIAIAVPTHRLGEGLAARINELRGIEIAREWHGTDQPDPNAPGEKMCRVAGAASEVIAAGGKLQFLCSSSQNRCPHHPRAVGSQCCGYQRQQLAAGQARAWIIPSNMLASPPPPALRRALRSTLGDFDLLVVDEAPWLGLLGGHDIEPEGVPIGWLAPNWWSDQHSRCSDEQKHRFLDLLTRLHGFLSACNQGVVPIEALQEAGITSHRLKDARKLIWRWKQSLRPLIAPGAERVVLDPVAAVNERVLAVSKLLSAIMLRLTGQLAPSGLELIDVPGRGGPFVRLRWRKDIHSAWLMSPVLYLDAAGTGGVALAQAWLPRIEMAIEARAKAPHMRVIQLTDTAMSYEKIKAEKTVRDLARVIEVLGGNGLVVAPMKLHQHWEGSGQLPNLTHWHFGAIRGRDDARGVSNLTVVSRPLPPAADIELMAETVFGRSVNRIRGESWYPKSPVGRLMADGTGRRVLACRHPDPMVEAVRFAICEGELLQAVGRGRGVQRDADSPLNVLILTNVPIPVPVDETISWPELRDMIGPIAVLAARGVVPLDYSGMAAVLSDWFTDADAAKEWFRYRAEAQARLDVIRTQARRGEGFLMSDLVGISFSNILKGNSHQVRPFRYRRSSDYQSKIVLVDIAAHSEPRAAVEGVLGKLVRFEPVYSGAEASSAPHQAGSELQDVSAEFFSGIRDFLDELQTPTRRNTRNGQFHPGFFARVQEFFQDLRATN